MSRIGRMPIAIPAGVTVDVDGNIVKAKGPKGELVKVMHPDMIIEIEGAEINVKRPSESKEHKSLHGLTRTLVSNMVTGVNAGYKKELDIVGVGYRASMAGSQLQLNVGYSHQVLMSPADGITVEVPSANKVIISGIDKQAVGQFAAEVRMKRPPEPYKGKGIRYTGEVVRRKEGKTGSKKK